MSQPVMHNGIEIVQQKQTTPGLYVTAAEAYDMWKADPDKVKVLDVRTLEEYIFVGHAAMAWNIPLAFQTHTWDDEKHMFAVKPNPLFVEQVNSWATPQDILLVICRSGGRSAMAVNMLANSGFKNVYNIIDGMEGDLVKDPENLFHGKRMKNGWKNSGVPWTYENNPKQITLT